MAGNHQDGEWCSVHLGEVTHEVTDRLGASTTDVPVYGVDRMDGLTPSPKYQAADLVRYKKVSPGMFAYNPMRLNIGSIGYCSSRHKLGVVSPDYVVFACRRDRLEPDYLYWLTKSASWADWVEAAGVGSVRVRIYYRELKRMPVRLPSVAAQRGILGVLRVLEDKIEQNRRTALALERMARVIFRAWFVDFEPVKAKAAGATLFPSVPQTVFDALPTRFIDSEIGPVPEGWEVSTIGMCSSYLSRGIAPKYVQEGGVLVLNQKCIRDFNIDFEKARRQDNELRKIDGRELAVGDVLINSTGVGTLGRVAQILSLPERAVADSHITVIRSSSNVNWVFLGQALMLRQPVIEAMGEGSTGQTELSRKKVSDMQVVVPPAPVLAAFDDIVLPLMRLISGTRTESRKLVEMRDYLLPKLLSGQVRVVPAPEQPEASI